MPRIAPRLIFLMIGLIALSGAWWLYADYSNDPTSLWRDLYHDRNTHLSRGMALASDIRGLDPLTYLLDATAITVWPPFHAIFLSIVMAIFGLHSGLGLIPGLFGWVLMILCTWQIAQRVSRNEFDGIVAGSVAIIFIVASPALRLLSADVMLEGLGAGLSAAVLLGFICLSKQPDRQLCARLFASGLTLLFFTKFNYWLVLTFLVLVSCASGFRFADVFSRQNRDSFFPIGRSFLRSPVTLLAGALFILTLVIAASGITSLQLFGRTFLLHAGQWVVIPYGLLLVSACRTWRKHSHELTKSLPGYSVTILGWHVLPLALWFLVPEAWTSFLWFIGPTHWGAQTHYNPVTALWFQWWGFSHGFHVAQWSAVVALGLAIPGGAVLFSRHLGSRTVAMFAVISVFAVVLHPQQQWRFQTTSLFAVWICSGVGASWLIHQLRNPAFAFIRIPVAIATIAGLFAVHALTPPNREDVEKVAIRRSSAPRDTDLAAAYLPFVRNSPAVGFATSFGFSDLFAWTIRESCQCHGAIEQAPLIGATTSTGAREIMADWLMTTKSDRIVFVDAPAPYPLRGVGRLQDRLAGVDTMIATSGLFDQEASGIKVGPATLQIWRRKPDASVPPSRRRLLFIGSLALVLGGLAVSELLRGRSRPRASL
ncbi:hypothetical protein BH10PSE11_BH10PSE11_08030 [soil metagenome]